jgi:hypothetical protein
MKDMTTMTTTGWFSGSVRPVHEGVYQRRFPAGPYSCWSGQRWFGDAATAAVAATALEASRYPSAEWRGLRTPSSLPCAACRGHGVIDQGEDDPAGWPLLRDCPEC